ncbi:hypothetical protein ADM96_37785 [Burkholderia sp. ST111]|nr:hypothetical protein ADM96_37785 [Burkholderia sp. ST111]
MAKSDRWLGDDNAHAAHRAVTNVRVRNVLSSMRTPCSIQYAGRANRTAANVRSAHEARFMRVNRSHEVTLLQRFVAAAHEAECTASPCAVRSR